MDGKQNVLIQIEKMYGKVGTESETRQDPAAVHQRPPVELNPSLAEKYDIVNEGCTFRISGQGTTVVNAINYMDDPKSAKDDHTGKVLNVGCDFSQSEGSTGKVTLNQVNYGIPEDDKMAMKKLKRLLKKSNRNS